MKIVLSGYYGFHNTGDEAILQSIIQQLKTHRPDIHIIVLSQDPVYTKQTYEVDAVNRWNMREIIKALKQSDGFISGGGSLLQDATGPKSILYYTGVIHLAKWLKKPVYVYSQGMGPFHMKISRQLVKLALNRVDGLSVRDRLSKNLLERVGVSEKIEIIPDPVFAMSPPASSGQVSETQKIAVSVRDWNNADHYLPKIAAALDQFVNLGYEIVFVPMHGEADVKCSKRLASSMKEQSSIYTGNSTIEEKLSFIASSAVLIGMRLHALIFASICNVPFMALSYDPKIKALTEQLGFPVTADVEDDTWASQTIVEGIEEILHNRDTHQSVLAEKTALLREGATSAPLKALHCFQSYK